MRVQVGLFLKSNAFVVSISSKTCCFLELVRFKKERCFLLPVWFNGTVQFHMVDAVWNEGVPFYGWYRLRQNFKSYVSFYSEWCVRHKRWFLQLVWLDKRSFVYMTGMIYGNSSVSYNKNYSKRKHCLW